MTLPILVRAYPESQELFSADESQPEIAVNYLVTTLVWIGCVIVGAAIGFLAGYVLWKLGFELIGGAVAVVGACVGGFFVLAGLASWSNKRRT